MLMHDPHLQDGPPEDLMPQLPYRFSSPKGPNVMNFSDGGGEAKPGYGERDDDLERDTPTLRLGFNPSAATIGLSE